MEPWWPVGYGNHKLYDLKVSFVSLLGENSARTLRVGFRRVELVQEKVGKIYLYISLIVTNIYVSW